MTALGACLSDQQTPTPKADQSSAAQPASSTPQDTDSGSGTSQSTQAPFFEIVDHAAIGAGCLIEGDMKNATAIVTNSIPDGPKDYAQWTFDDLSAPGPNGNLISACELRLDLEWSPGYRVKSKAMELDLWFNGPLETKVFYDLSFPNRPMHSGSTTLEDLESSAQLKLAQGEGMSSDCSGKGTWVAKFHLHAKDRSEEKNSIEINQASLLFELAQEGEFEPCPSTD